MNYSQTAVIAFSFVTITSLVSCASRTEPVPANVPVSSPVTLTDATLSLSAGSITFNFKVTGSTAVDVKTIELAMLHAQVQDKQTGKSIRLFEVIRPMPIYDVDAALRYSDGFPDGHLTVSFPDRYGEYITMTNISHKYLHSERGTHVAILCDERVYIKDRFETSKARRIRLELIQCLVVD